MSSGRFSGSKPPVMKPPQPFWTRTVMCWPMSFPLSKPSMRDSAAWYRNWPRAPIFKMLTRSQASALKQAAFGWHDLSAIAVTQGPGLAGALLVGISYAKSLAYALEIPLVGVNHLEGHIASAWIDRPSFPRACVVLIASGGHTHLFQALEEGGFRLMGRTIDDAAGEAFDKGAQMLGLGYPGGPLIDKVARNGRPASVRFPRSRVRTGQLDFSFSGLKTALLYHVQRMSPQAIAEQQADLAAAYQEAIVDILVRQAFAAVEQAGVSALAVVGGVSANSRLRARLAARASEEGIELSLPALSFCTDNAAMIAAAGQRAILCGKLAAFDCEAMPTFALSSPTHYQQWQHQIVTFDYQGARPSQQSTDKSADSKPVISRR